jgi:ribosome maturation factor RimP
MEEDKTILDQIRELARPLLREGALELVDLEYRQERKGWTIRLFLDREGGITLDELAGVSRELSTLLDVENIIPQAYTLEVSSPGLERPLKKEADFERYTGRKAKIKLSQPVSGEKDYQGILKGVEAGEVLLEEASGVRKIPLAVIKKARLIFEWGAKMGTNKFPIQK